MSKIETLKDLYADELKDLWSANDQVAKVVREMADAADEDALATRLEESLAEIEGHTAMLEEMLGELDEDVEKAHCKGMEGLVKEARKHALEEEFADAGLQDIAIIAQYQRMAHYGLAGFGTARAYAEALGEDAQAERLGEALDDLYSTDKYLSALAERCSGLDRADD